MAKRRAVGFLMHELGLSERRSCRIAGIARSVQQYRSTERTDAAASGFKLDPLSRRGSQLPADLREDAQRILETRGAPFLDRDTDRVRRGA